MAIQTCTESILSILFSIQLLTVILQTQRHLMQSVLLTLYVSLVLPDFPDSSSSNPSHFTTLCLFFFGFLVFLHNSSSHTQFSNKLHQYKLQAHKPGFMPVKQKFIHSQGRYAFSFPAKKVPTNIWEASYCSTENHFSIIIGHHHVLEIIPTSEEPIPRTEEQNV